jgi:hypothetical protein
MFRESPRKDRASCHAVRKPASASRAALMAGAALAGLLVAADFALPDQAHAAGCTITSGGGFDTLQCTGAGNNYNPGGISYTDSTANNLSVIATGVLGILPPVVVYNPAPAGNGIYAASTTLGKNVYISTQYVGSSATSVYGVATGIYGKANGGNVSINTYGTYVNSAGTGVKAVTSGYGDVNVTIGSGGVGGPTYGVHALPYTGNTSTYTGVYTSTGAGTTNITTNGKVYGANHGIVAKSGNGTINITANNVVNGNADGLYIGTGISAVSTDGSIHITVGANGVITGGEIGSGIYAKTGKDFIVIDMNGTVAYGGIVAKTTGAYTGDSITVNLRGNVTGGSYGGVYASTNAGCVSVSQYSGNISAFKRGIDARTVTGGISIYTGNGTTVTSTGNTAIYAYASGNSTWNVNVTTHGNISSSHYLGIDAGTRGSGAVTVKTYGTINSYGDGVHAHTYLNGNVTVNTNGAITTHTGDGVFASSHGGGNVSVTTHNAINAGADGIDVYNYGNGNITVNATGNITAGSDGVSASARNGTGDVLVTTNGNISSPFGDGVHAYAFSGNVTVGEKGNITAVNGNATTGGYGVYGKTNGNGFVHVTTNGNISSYKDGVQAFANGTGPVTVDTTGNIASSTGEGINAQTNLTNGNGNVSVTTHGAYSIVGHNNGVRAYAYGAGNVTISTSGNLTGQTRSGVIGRAEGSGNVSITTTNGAIYGHFDGIRAYTNGAGSVSVNATGPITSKTDIGVWADAGAGGAVSVTTNGPINASNFGIFARSENAGTGNVTVNATGNITQTGGSGGGILAGSTGSGAVSVTTNGNISSVGHGIYAYTKIGNGNVSVLESGNITTTGADSMGVYAKSAHAGFTYVSTHGNISSQGDGIDGYAWYNGTTVKATGNITSAHGLGIYAMGDRNGGGSGVGNVLVTNTGNINSYRAGIFASSYGNGTVTVTSTGNITSTIGIMAGQGIFAHSDFGGAVSVTSNGAISAWGDGVHAYAQGGGSVTGNTTGNIISSHGAGIWAKSGGAGAVSITSLGNITSHGDGIYAQNDSGSGNVTVNSTGNITATGNASSRGIYANALGDGNVSITAAGNVTSQGTGIFGYAHGNGSVVVHSTANVTTTVGAAVYGDSSGYGNGNVTVVTSGHNWSLNGVGGEIGDYNSSGNVSVTSNGSSIAYGGPSAAVWAQNNGSGTTYVHNTGYAKGFNGVLAWSGTGQATIINTATVQAKNYGLWARTYGGSISVTNSGYVHASGAVSGNSSCGGGSGVGVGICAEVDAPVIRAITTAGIHTDVINPQVVPGGEVGVYNTKYSVAYGHADGIRIANSGTGISSVINAGAAIGHTQYGVDIYNKGGGAASVLNVGTIAGGAAGVLIDNNGGAHVYVDNWSGAEIFGANTGIAIQTFSSGAWTSGATAVTNYQGGTIWGHVILSANSTVSNAGQWNTYGNSYFAPGGNTTVNTITNKNTGVIWLDDVGGVPQTVTISNLTQLNNQGLVDLRNGHAGDVLNIAGGVGAGVWNSTAGSTLGIDANLTGPLVADKLVVGSVTSTSVGGNATTILLHDATPSAPASINVVGVPVVVANNGGPAGAFTMAVYHKGFVNYELVDPAATWLLLGVPASNAFELLKAPAFGQDFWRRSADAWSAREQEVRDSMWGSAPPTRAPGWEAWAQAYVGDQDDTRPTQTVSVGGVSFTPGLGSNTDWRGFQMGGDQLTTNNWLWGFTAGFAEQNSRFRTLQPVLGGTIPVVHDDVDIQGWNIGVYGGWTSGMFFVNGLLKSDWFTVNANMPSAGAQKDFDGETWGAKGEAGFRFGSPSFYLEPLADIDWTTTHLSHVTLAGNTFTWPDSTSSKGEIGARMGGQWGSILPYLGVYAVDNWSGNNKMTLITGVCPGACMSVEDTAPGSYGKADFGFTITNWHGLEGYLKGEALFGNHVQGETGRLGVRWHW